MISLIMITEFATSILHPRQNFERVLRAPFFDFEREGGKKE